MKQFNFLSLFIILVLLRVLCFESTFDGKDKLGNSNGKGVLKRLYSLQIEYNDLQGFVYVGNYIAAD